MFVLPVASTQLGFQDLSANSHRNSCQLLQGFSIELICLLHLDPRHQSWLPNTFQYWYFSAILSLWASPMSKQIKWSNSIHMHKFKQTSLELNYNFEPPSPPKKKLLPYNPEQKNSSKDLKFSPAAALCKPWKHTLQMGFFLGLLLF